MNPSTGALSLVAEMPMGGTYADLEAMTVDALGRYLYVAQNAQNADSRITTFAVNAATGALTQAQSGSACGLQCYADTAAIEVHPTGRYVLTLRPTSPFGGEIESFTVEAATGALTFVDFHDIGGSYITSTTRDAFDTALESTGRFLYVTVEAGDPDHFPASIRQIRLLTLNLLTGSIASESTALTVADYTHTLIVGGPIR